MNICVFGAGYVGLVTAVCLAEIGHQVICIDNDTNKITQLAQSIPPIYETGLQPLLNKHLDLQNIYFSSNPLDAIRFSNVYIIAVGTPLKDNGEINLDYVYEVSSTLAENINDNCTIILKSTVPPGTANALLSHINHILKSRNINTHADVANNPEFLQEGSAIQQFMHPDRLIVGAENVATIQLIYEIYEPLIKNKEQFVIMDKASAELTKYAANALLATKISFINEISQIAEHVGADIDRVKNGIGLDYRINPLFLNAGCGFGGSCFPKDVMSLIGTAKHLGVQPFILDAVMKRNSQQQQLLFDKVKTHFNHELQDKTIGLWGLAFKPNTDDIRCATSRILAELFWREGCFIKAYDPLAMENFASAYPDHFQLELCSSPFDVLDGTDALVIVTEWPEFKQVPLAEIKRLLRYPVIFDGRNIFHPEEVKQHQLEYYAIGKPNHLKKSWQEQETVV